MKDAVERGDHALNLEFQTGKSSAGFRQPAIASRMFDRARGHDRFVGAEDEKGTYQLMSGALQLRGVASVEKRPDVRERPRRLLDLHLRQRQEHFLLAAEALEQLVEGQFERRGMKRLRR